MKKPGGGKVHAARRGPDLLAERRQGNRRRDDWSLAPRAASDLLARDGSHWHEIGPRSGREE